MRAVTFEGKGNNNGIKIRWGCGQQPHTEIIGEGKDSEASNAIIAAADKPDPRPLWISVWGGPREVAQAIWKVKNTRSEADLKAFIGKLRVFLIACQDASHEWLMTEFPDLFIIESRKTYQGMFGSDSRAWAEENIIKNHGPLGAIYPPKAVAGPGVIREIRLRSCIWSARIAGSTTLKIPPSPVGVDSTNASPTRIITWMGSGHRASPNGARTIRKSFKNEPTGCCRESERGFCLKGNNMRLNANQTRILLTVAFTALMFGLAAMPVSAADDPVPPLVKLCVGASRTHPQATHRITGGLSATLWPALPKSQPTIGSAGNLRASARGRTTVSNSRIRSTDAKVRSAGGHARFSSAL